MKRLYMIQRCCSTSALTVPASSRIARAAVPAMDPSRISERGRKRSVVRSAMALMKPG
jgi:hypothetical protein